MNELSTLYQPAPYEFLNTRKDVQAWLSQHNIKNYTIEDNLIVNVAGSVYFDGHELTHLPVKFGKVAGDFSCSGVGFTTCQGFPREVSYDVWVCNNKLTTIQYAPEKIGGSFYIWGNQITNLAQLTCEISEDLYCHTNPLRLDNINEWNFTVKKEIILTPDETLAYFKEYLDEDGDIIMDFNLFKKSWKAKMLNDKINSTIENTHPDRNEAMSDKRFKI
jgi:hypothetical protein